MKNLQDMIGMPIRYIPCAHCGNDDTYYVDTYETDFLYDGTGHYFVDYHCKNCKKNFSTYFRFKYKIIEAYQ